MKSLLHSNLNLAERFTSLEYGAMLQSNNVWPEQFESPPNTFRFQAAFINKAAKISQWF